MNTSESTDKIYPAIIAIQGEMAAVPKDKEVEVKHKSGGTHKFKYAPLDSIMDVLRPLLLKHGLGVVQAVNEDALSTRLIHNSGQWVQSQTFLNRDHASMQGFGGEVTYKRRYALSALIGIVSDEDTDAGGPNAQSRTGVKDGSVRGGIGDDLPEDWKIFLQDRADECTNMVRRGKAAEAYELILSDKLEDDQRIWMEGRMPSDVRRAIKDAGNAARSR